MGRVSLDRIGSELSLRSVRSFADKSHVIRKTPLFTIWTIHSAIGWWHDNDAEKGGEYNRTTGHAFISIAP